MAFASLGLHADLLRGVRELGFTRPTPIQEQAIPPALEGRDLLAWRHDRQRARPRRSCCRSSSACSGSPAAPRGLSSSRRRASWRRRSREHLEALALHTPLSGAAIFGGVGMGPQEHAFRTGVDVVVATPGRLLDHFRFPYARPSRASRSSSSTKPTACSTWAFSPTSGGSCATFRPSGRRSSSPPPCRPPIVTLAKEMLRNPVTIDLGRKSAPPIGITQAAYPVPCRAEVGAARGAAEARRRSGASSPSLERSIEPTGWRTTWRGTASPPPGSTATAARPSAPRPWPGSRPASTRCSWRRTSRPGASTSKPSPTS